MNPMFTRFTRMLALLLALASVPAIAMAQAPDAEPSFKIGDRVYHRENDKLGEGEIVSLLPPNATNPERGAWVKWESAKPNRVPLGLLALLYTPAAAAVTSKSTSAEAFLLFADLGPLAKMTVFDIEFALSQVLKRGQGNAIDLVVSIPTSPVDCLHCERDGVSEAFTVLEIQRYPAEVREKIFGSIGAALGNGGPTLPFQTLHAALERFSQRYRDRNRTVLFVTEGAQVVQTRDEETSKFNLYVTQQAEFADNVSEADRAAAVQVAALAQREKIPVHALQLPRNVNVRVHVDPHGRCYYITRTMTRPPTNSIVAELAAKTGGSFSALSELSGTGPGSSSAAVDAAVDWLDRVIAQVQQKGEKSGSYGVTIVAPPKKQN